MNFGRHRSINPTDDEEKGVGRAEMASMARKYGYGGLGTQNSDNNKLNAGNSQRKNATSPKQSRKLSQVGARSSAAHAQTKGAVNMEGDEESAAKDQGHEAVRQETMRRLNDLLQIQVRKTFSLKHQEEAIRNEGGISSSDHSNTYIVNFVKLCVDTH